MNMERVLGEPALVLCATCMDSEELEPRWLPLRCGDDEALLTREVCVCPRCPRLQVCGHLCAVHGLELELAWQGNYTVRACHGCRVSTLQLYREQRDVWFILEGGAHLRGAHGVERRVKTPKSDGSSSPEAKMSTAARLLAAGKRPIGKRPLRRKSTRFIKQLVLKEQKLAFEWSLGNLPLDKSRRLWRDNAKRIEMEKNPEAYYAARKLPVKEKPDPNVRPEPREVFCVFPRCKRFAKTGDCCRFHSSAPLVFIKPVVQAVATSVSAK